MNIRRSFLFVMGCSILIQGCVSQPPAPVETRDLAAEVRDEAASQSGVIEVFPLTDPAAAELLRQARLAEAEERLFDAAELTGKALDINPEDPDQWQYLAELQLKLQAFDASILAARKSYDLGPKIGQLCYRNWLTISRAEESLGAADKAQEAAQRADECTLQAQPRY